MTDSSCASSLDIGVISRQCLGAGFVRTEDFEKRAEQVMAGVLRLAPHPKWKSVNLATWDADPFSSRNWQFQHHALRWLSPVRYLASEGREDAREYWMNTVRSWIENNPTDNPPSRFSWVDMADGLRAQEIVFGWPLATSEAEQHLLLGALRTHGEWLADEEHQVSGNHALHQNVGLFVLASFLKHEDWQQLAILRMEALFDSAFDTSGANDEGSIDYHRMNLSWWRGTWDRVLAEGAEIPAHVNETLSKAATFLAHATRPDGTMVPLGDTHLRQVHANDWPELEYVASRGESGQPPATTVVAAPNGYILGRSSWGTTAIPFSDQTHYSLRYGNHKARHQHEDRGSITLFSGGQDWITDPGSYLYEPKDPFRKYLRSRESHNVVLVDDVEYGQSDRVWLKACHVDEVGHDYTVVDTNYSGVELTRRVVYLPLLDLMVVLDHVAGDSKVTSRQVWHTEPGIKPRYRDSALELQKNDGAKFTVRWLGNGERPKVTYGNESSVKEWVSRKWGDKTPAAGFEVSRTASSAFFATVLGDSTRDAWSISSSRAKPENTWIRILRFGRVWNVEITPEGVSVEEDTQFDQSSPQGELANTVGARMEAALLNRRISELERELVSFRAQLAERTTTSSGASDRVEKLETTVDSLSMLQHAATQREIQRVAALLTSLPWDADTRAILGGLDIADIIPHIKNPLYLHELWVKRGDRVALNLSDRRKLAKDLYQRGYLVRSYEVIQGIAATTLREKDERISLLRASELAMMRGDVELEVPIPETYTAVTGRILHVVGKAIPETQTGYTLRTHYLAQAQSVKGYDVHVMRQAGGVPEPLAANEVVLDEVTYHLPEGPARGSVTWDKWLQINAMELFNLVERIRPSLLHCHSDFINQLIAKPVAEAFNIPLVYESRGFWEESWLSRVETQVGRSLDKDYEYYGLPEAYTLRREREDQARRSSDHVTTLAEVMKQHIVDRGEDPNRISVTPNGVQPEDFPVVGPDLELKAELGIPLDAPVIGYITSVVEYEGIDTLVTAFSRMRQLGEDAWLLLVGDGPVRRSLQQFAKSLGVSDRVLFTGRVSHEKILGYYSLIDLFVVPRKNRDVCRLVTPLKPFEALCSGRTVVVSNVDALQEIADQSQATATFEAGDAESLTTVLRRLLANPSRRRELSERGSAWARLQRSWAAIATMYDAPYEKLGVKFFNDIESNQAMSAIDPKSVRSELRNLTREESIRYLRVHSDPRKSDSVQQATQVMLEGWGGHGFAPVSFPDDLDWHSFDQEDRTWQMHVHSWEFMTPILEAWAETGEDRFVEWAVHRALTWFQAFPAIDFCSMAWYDMALSYRSVALQALVRSSAACASVTDRQFEQLLRLALLQRDAHWHEKSFNARNNHGYYSAVSQVVLASAISGLPGMRALHAQGNDRLRVMTDGQFLSDGGHAEHSPDYHRMLLSSFEGAIKVEAIDDPEVLDRIRKAADVLGWMILPTNTILQMGDSPERQMSGSQTSISSSTEWVLSQGKRGRRPDNDSLLLPESGYAFVRKLATGKDVEMHSSYLAMTAGFHSRTHKHCDDQSLVWFEKGQEILVDGGRYRYGELLPQDSELRSLGFYYADPMRQYMESCAAHSTLSLDGSMQDRRRTPYGSGISNLTQNNDGFYVIHSTVPHNGWTSRRVVTYKPGFTLTISDRVVADDDKTHTLHTWYLLDGSLQLEEGDQEITIRSHAWDTPMTITRNTHQMEDLSVSTNHTEGIIRGVRSRQDRTVEPAWSLEYQLEFSGVAETQTIFTFDQSEN
ncbi:heparinase II/III family protein [Kocuria sp. cx-116]|uniref:heparinase II/III domain-containing protein n=1 Tax=Kocuria sp. cx-116 TaxID=2771378 RepID=UPI00168422F2|nr:heparinase II/III family protein [Kocuria sp. cx-116]MBD2761399.1 heparinase II/III family protein [Kocuria sp. cx-116]